MGCNCGKKRSATPMSRAQERAAAQGSDKNQSGMATPESMRQASQPRGRTQSFALKLNTGKTLEFGSKLEAEAANVRMGYTGTVKPL